MRADRIVAVIPIEEPKRGEGRRTYVHVEGVAGPIVASRSERAIVSDMEDALPEPAEADGTRVPPMPARRRLFGRAPRLDRRRG